MGAVATIVLVLSGAGVIVLILYLFLRSSPELLAEVTGGTGMLYITLFAYNPDARAGVSYRWVDAGVW